MSTLGMHLLLRVNWLYVHFGNAFAPKGELVICPLWECTGSYGWTDGMSTIGMQLLRVDWWHVHFGKAALKGGLMVCPL